MKSFLCRLFIVSFIVGIITFCNQYGIGNIPKKPMSRDELLFVVPCTILILVALSYFFKEKQIDEKKSRLRRVGKKATPALRHAQRP